jgi:hypothetical protein
MAPVVAYTAHLDAAAIAGYASLVAFALFKLSDTVSRPVDLAANVLLIAGLVALVAYHWDRVASRGRRDVENDTAQRSTRIVAHAAIVAFLVLTLLPASAAKFRFYDGFALVAHAQLLVAVSVGFTQLPGVVLLAVYFALAALQTSRARELIDSGELLQLLGRLLLLFFFAASSAMGIATLVQDRM